MIARFLLVGAVAASVVLSVGLWRDWWTVPPRWNPWAPLAIDQAPNALTSWKLGRLADQPERCLAVLGAASRDGLGYRALPDHEPVDGCPLTNVVRISETGVGFNRSFLASCPLAVAWRIYERHRLQPAATAILGAPVSQVEHYGSFACRNIYGRESARRSDHAAANALDVAAFRLRDGRRITISRDWGGEDSAAAFLERAFDGACDVFGTVLGPEYNAAHADHFHLGMRRFGVCR